MVGTRDSHRQAVLVTGTTSGIGEAFVALFARQGRALVLVSRDAERLALQKERIESRFQVPVLTIACDLSDPWVVEEIVAEIDHQRWQIDILVNNAGFNECGAFCETNLGHELQMIQTHVGTVTSLTKRLLPGMTRRRSGRILNVASIGGLLPCPDDAVYGATKAYVVSFSEALAAELEGSGVSVTLLLPGAVRTASAAKAGVADRLLFNVGVMEPRRVARIGYQALLKGRRRVVAGWHNWLLAVMLPFMPRFGRERLVRLVWRPITVGRSGKGAAGGHPTRCCFSGLRR